MAIAISRIIQALEPSATLAMAAKAKELKAAGKTVYDFSVGEPDFNTPQHICDAAVRAMQAGHTHYTVASGIFNICLDHPRSDWEPYVAATLDRIHAASLRGFAVNFMHPRTLIERPDIAGQVYTAESAQWLGYCTDHLQCDVQCLKNYGLNEFTLLATRAPS